jgi:hypothetical protein
VTEAPRSYASFVSPSRRTDRPPRIDYYPHFPWNQPWVDQRPDEHRTDDPDGRRPRRFAPGPATVFFAVAAILVLIAALFARGAPDLYNEVRFHVDTADGSRPLVAIDYLDDDGSRATVVTRTPWESPELTFGFHVRVEVHAHLVQGQEEAGLVCSVTVSPGDDTVVGNGPFSACLAALTT